jgi:exonuclease VII small subunit
VSHGIIDSFLHGIRDSVRPEGDLVSATEIQALLLGAGGFVGTSMAGIGAYRLCAVASRGIMRIPTSLERGADALERSVRALEMQNAVSAQVVELKGLMTATRDDIQKIMLERQEIGRELRIMSRKIEGFSCHAQDQE